jgi:putative PIN family toxin of toxin-antitoxin system
MRVVLDTNVLLSGSRGHDTPPVIIYTAWQNQEITLIFSPQMIREIQRVLTYPKVKTLLGAAFEQVQQDFDGIYSSAVIVRGEQTIEYVNDDPSDNISLAAAIEGYADYIVTGDARHLLP